MKLRLKTKLLLMKIINLLKTTKKWLIFLTLSLWILHLALRSTINHYLKIEIFQKLRNMQLKNLKIIEIYLELKTIEIQLISFLLNLSLCEKCPFGLTTEKYSVYLRIQSKCGKIRIRKNSAFGHFSRSVLQRKW